MRSYSSAHTTYTYKDGYKDRFGLSATQRVYISLACTYIAVRRHIATPHATAFFIAHGVRLLTQRYRTQRFFAVQYATSLFDGSLTALQLRCPSSISEVHSPRLHTHVHRFL